VNRDHDDFNSVEGGSPEALSKVSVWGPRRLNRDPTDVLAEAEASFRSIASGGLKHYGSVEAMRADFRSPAKAYFTLAAMTRRRVLAPAFREAGHTLLFRFRARLEDRICSSLRFNEASLDLLRYACSESFFGFSSKQGVSVRYPLSTCRPTDRCGAGCYAHDGRDREFSQIFRGALNGYAGSEYESGDEPRRTEIKRLLSRAIDKAVAAAHADAQQAAAGNFVRAPRVRLSHVGEMAATPDFTNMLAREMKTRLPSIQCVIYTRHPWSKRLDPSVVNVNFTIEGSSDPRRSYAPAFARLVSSAWDGEVVLEAEVNFLEHHVEKSWSARGAGNVCPVTVDHARYPSCDTAKCTKCFDPPRETP
jgi:hypothetical protein